MHKKLLHVMLYSIFFTTQIYSMQATKPCIKTQSHSKKNYRVSFADQQMTLDGLTHKFNLLTHHIQLQPKYGTHEPLTQEDIKTLWTSKKEDDLARKMHQQSIHPDERLKIQEKRAAHKQNILSAYVTQLDKKKDLQCKKSTHRLHNSCLILTGVITAGIGAVMITAQFHNQKL